MGAATLRTGRPALRAHAGVRAGVLAAAPLVAITLVGAVLRLWDFGRVAPDQFYEAAVRSMSLSWHNFFFGAYEPAAQVSIDKAPADLWLQVASVKLFGYSTTATRLPEVAAGILAIPLLYDLVRRLFGRRAGLGAAAALAVLPTAILTAHSDTMDSVMMLLDVLAAWLVVVGARSRKAWPVVAAGAVLGLAFNVKLFEALIALPPIAVLMLLTVDLPARRKALALAGSLAAFVAVGMSWIVAASLTPLGGRPWPIGSSDGSVWSVVFGFNGIDRLQARATPRALALDPPGPLRFFHPANHEYASTVGTMLFAALVLGAIATAVAFAHRRRGTRFDRIALAGGLFLATWLVLGAGLTSNMQRLQPRYLEAVTPAIAAVVGVGLARLVEAARARGGDDALPLLGAIALTAAGGVLLAHPPLWGTLLAGAAVVGCVLAAAARGWPRQTAALAVLGLVAVLAVPATGAVSVARGHGSDAGVPSRTPPGRIAALSRFLIAHQGRARYEAVSASAVRASPLIIRDARPVLMLTSYQGRSVLDVAGLRQRVVTGQVRYALLGGTSCTAHKCTPAMRWARAHSRDVSAAAGQPPGTVYRFTAAPAAGRGT